ncbi:MAG: ABC transporter ATP-binding protein [Vulcanisaeta sp.]|nr:ABC transporter ATP-binding protein [Vulcanisaeta sp.]MCG2869505.1 ABC transporter ATP-binding protein [Vulcanisaeta sp.]MCG2886465.1 ABC transporter ATP-binding protein [Vulcanisaeta sp.]
MGSTVELRDVVANLRFFRLGPVTTVFDRGSYNVVLGPTGSGKSTLLKVIAGVYRVSSGRVIIDGEDVTEKPPEARNISYIPQGYAIFDHMSVYENIEYGLKIRGVPKAERRRLVMEIAEDLGIKHLLSRRAVNLSGGEQQRVALARALVVRPRVLLMDEPLSMLDRETRDRIIPLLRELPSRYGITVIHVTHDWDEAYSLADKVIVMNMGRIIEEGRPEQVFERPRSIFTAQFLGFQNIFRGVAERVSGGSVIKVGGIRFYSDEEASGNVYVCIRPEWVEVLRDDNAPSSVDDNVFRVVVKGVIKTRVGYRATVSLGDDLMITVLSRVPLNPGDEVLIRVPRGYVHVIAE